MSSLAFAIQFQGTVSEQKHELLFSRFGINYAREPEMYRRGSVLLRGVQDEEVVDSRTQQPVRRQRRCILVCHDSIIEDSWWAQHTDILA